MVKGKTITGMLTGLLLLSATVLPSCRREPLYEQASDIRLILNLNLSEDDDAMWCKPKAPSLVRTIFYDRTTGERVATIFTGREGGSVVGVDAGTYTVLSFNDDCEYTRITGEDNLNTITAYTESVSMPAGSGLLTKADEYYAIREPDHLLVGLDTALVVPLVEKQDTTITLTSTLKTVMDSYYIRIDSLKGLQNVNSVALYLTGHSGYNEIGKKARSTEDETLYIGTVRPDPTYTYLQGTFCTFGKIPGTGGMAYIEIVVTGAGGTVYHFEQDITEQYADPKHVLMLCVKGEIKPQEQGGFEPEVDEWSEETDDIDIM